MGPISSASTQYVRAIVDPDFTTAVNPTVYTVDMAFLSNLVAPIAGDWKAASWESPVETDSCGAGVYRAICLIGPAGVVALTAGWYNVYVRITTPTEVPVLAAGRLQIV